MDKELEDIQIKIRNNFRIFEYGDDFFIQHRSKYNLFGIRIPLGWRYYPNNEKTCFSDLIQFLNLIFWLAISIWSIVIFIQYLIPVTYSIKPLYIAYLVGGATFIAHLLLKKFSKDGSIPLRTYEGAESHVESITHEMAKQELLDNKVRLQKLNERQEKQQKKMKKKTNKKYHYLYDERTMRKEKLTQLK